ncbi:hypothetical protein [Pseudarthrobacter siccitolerans]
MTATNNVTAKPFKISSSNKPAGKNDEFWSQISILPVELGHINDDGEGGEIEVLPVPPKTSNGIQNMRDFLERYDDMVLNLARIRATTEEILKRSSS